MMLLLHIMTAFGGMAFTAYTYLAPSRRKLQTSYAFASATLATGTYLLIIKPSHLLEACIMGLIYFAIVGAGIYLAQNKLTYQIAKSKDM
ncbi:MAG TPA: hypothetical protein VK694_03680 [Verrucomicrobiae bacterium]|nr:hypothetical protein [Verrucomicrobiae bacterium]